MAWRDRVIWLQVQNVFRRLWLPAALGLAFFAALHSIFSVVVAYGTPLYYRDRIFDVHRLKGSYEAEWIRTYVYDVVSNDHVVAAGSSFTFLYPYDEQDTYSAELNRRGIKTINVSATSYGTRAIFDNILCPLRDAARKPKAIILEIPLINDVTHMREPGAVGESAVISECPKPQNMGLTAFALSHPIGVGWASVMFDQFALAHAGDFIGLGEVPVGYFSSLEEFKVAEPRLAGNMKDVYALAKTISPHVLMFVTPVYFDGITKVKRDPEQVRPQFERAVELCKSIAGDSCVDTSHLLHVRHFANMTHFNRTGAEALAASFYERLVSKLEPDRKQFRPLLPSN
jgi:hypothetical protein